MPEAYENTERKYNIFRTYELPVSEVKGTAVWSVHSGTTQLKGHVTAEKTACQGHSIMPKI